MDALIYGLEELVPFEFKDNSYCFYGVKYWRNWWRIFTKNRQKICLPMLVFPFDFVLGTHNGQHKAFSAAELWAEALQIDIKTEFNQCIIHN